MPDIPPRLNAQEFIDKILSYDNSRITVGSNNAFVLTVRGPDDAPEVFVGPSTEFTDFSSYMLFLRKLKRIIGEDFIQRYLQDRLKG